MTKKLLLFTDYFIPTNIRSDTSQLYHARAIAVAALVAPIVYIAISISLFTFPTQPDSRAFGLYLMAITSAIRWAFLIAMRCGFNFTTLKKILIFETTATIAVAIVFTGGVIHSPASQLLPIAMVTAFLFGGSQLGVQLSSGLIAIVAITVAMEFSIEIRWPHVILTEFSRAQNAILLSANLAIMVALIYIYEFTSAALRRDRDIEHQKVVQLSQTDPLTGIANRRTFDKILAERIAQNDSPSAAKTFALGNIDLDGFKPINDQYGHQIGDTVLQAITMRLSSALRESDCVGRVGGDEFMLIIDEMCDPLLLAQMAKRLLHILHEPITTSAGLIKPGASIGFALFPAHARNLEALKKIADEAMYYAKRQRCGWHLYDPDTDKAVPTTESYNTNTLY